VAKKPTEEKKPGTALTHWREAMGTAAQKQAEMEQSSGGGKFFSMRAGVLKFDDVALPGNQIACVILHSIYENVYYADKFDPDNKTPPTCFAFHDADDEDEMQPHSIVDEEDCFERQNDVCDGCPMNEWGSADKGKGKACSNRRRLAIIPAGTYVSQGKNKGLELKMFEDAKPFRDADLAYMKLPVTSVKHYSQFVREISEQLDRPTWGVFANITVEPHEKYQVAVGFELIDEIPDELMDVIYKRHIEAKEAIAFPYRPPSEEDEAEAKPKAAASKKLTGGKKPAAAPAKKTTARRK